MSVELFGHVAILWCLVFQGVGMANQQKQVQQETA